MFTIINKQVIAVDVKRLDIQADAIARRVQPGQFVMVIPRENGEWIPLTVIESDPRRGVVTLVVKESDPSTRLLGSLPIKETIYSVLGPLGQPSVCNKKFGTVVCAASGLGVAQILPVCRNLTKLGNKVIAVIGARTRRDLVMESQMRLACYKIHLAVSDIATDKSSEKNEAGIVRQCLEQPPVDLVYAVGSVAMMQSISEMTKKKKIPCFIQANPVMSCGLGFCGSCRMRVGHQTVLACEQGPEFDGHKVDFADLKMRMDAYRKSDRPLMPKPAASLASPQSRGSIGKFFTDILRT